VSAGLSFGALPAFADLSPDQQAMVMQSLQARASEQQQPGSPDQLLFNRAGMGGGQNGFQPPEDGGPMQTGAVGREAHQSAPMVAMDEAAVQRMEQPMLPPTAGGNIPPVPQAAPPTQGGPVPPAMPQPSPGGAQPAPQAAPRMTPVNSFDPLTGQPTSGAPKAVTPTAAAQASGQAGGGGMFDKFLTGIQNPQVSDLLLNLGIGLMSQRGLGQGLAAGLQGYQKASSGNLSQQLQQIKFMQEQQAQAATKKYLAGKGLSPDAVEAAAGNPAILSALQTEMSQKPSLQTIGGKQYWLKPGETPGASNLAGEAGVPLDQEVAKARALADVADEHKEDKTVTPLTDVNARSAAGIPAGDNRPAWRDANGRVTFDNQNAPKIVPVRGPDGTTLQRVDPLTNTATPVTGGPGPADNSDVPAGVDPQAYRRERAKLVAGEQKAATDRSMQAASAAPLLDRAEKAYRTLSEAGGIGPFQASSPNRMFEGARGHPNEVARQDYEASAKELELMKAQISMKGQGAITEGERKILGLTLPRLDAASPETGLTTIQGLRGQFSRAQSTEGLPHAEQKPPAGAPEGSRQGKDGNWYVSDPNRPGKYLMVR
jgi:hypothetical protein